MSKVTPLEAIENIKDSADYFSKLHKEMKLDDEYSYGKQWKDADVAELEKVGVKALTINKIRPMVNLITGIEKQSRSDYKAFPEGAEDSPKAEVMTKLLKNVAKTAGLSKKTSEQFDRGVRTGMAVLEAYIDRSFDLITGELKFRLISAINVYIDPNFQEYDLSDAEYIGIVRSGMSKEQLKMLFPKKKSKIDSLEGGFKLGEGNDNEHTQPRDYGNRNKRADINDVKKETYDLVDYYYKTPTTHYFVADNVVGTVFETDNKDAAVKYAEQNTQVIVIEKDIPQIRLKQFVNELELADEVCEFYPAWKSYPLFGFIGEYAPVEIDSDLRFQGIVRSMRDLNDEFNKRRTQELRHLNSTVNSGWFVPSNGGKSALNKKDRSALTRLGASPGFVADYDAGIGIPTKILPTPLSQGHAQLAEENAQDMKEVSGVNPDLLAADNSSQSGRAILLKQRQGLVMIQGILDNYGNTKQRVGEFIVTQLSKLFTTERALKVVGEDFVEKMPAFKAPIHEIMQRAMAKQEHGQKISDIELKVLQLYPDASPEQPAVDENNNPVLVTDPEVVNQFINQVLTDTSLSKFDVSIGEGAFAETIRMSDYATMLDMAEKGVPIPPDLMIDHSMLPDSAKQRIKTAMQNMQAQPKVKQ